MRLGRTLALLGCAGLTGCVHCPDGWSTLLGMVTLVDVPLATVRLVPPEGRAVACEEITPDVFWCDFFDMQGEGGVFTVEVTREDGVVEGLEHRVRSDACGLLKPFEAEITLDGDGLRGDFRTLYKGEY
jgi:hypothetical protein